MTPVCLFCLEEIQGDPTPNPIGCSCKIQAHESCFHAWFEQKRNVECPICHTVSIPTPFQHENLHIVFVENRRDSGHQVPRHQKAVAACCCLLLGWTIGLTIIEAIFQAARS